MKFLSVISVGGSRTLSDLFNAGLRNLSFPCVCGERFLHVQYTWRCMHAACSTHIPTTPTDSTLLAPSSHIRTLALGPSMPLHVPTKFQDPVSWEYVGSCQLSVMAKVFFKSAITSQNRVYISAQKRNL